MCKTQKLVKCLRCSALYAPQKWLSGYYPNGTTDDFIVTGSISEDDCPICREPPLLKCE